MMLNKIKEEGIELQSNMQNIAVSTRDIDASRPYNRRIPLGGDNSGNGTAVADDEESDDEGEANDELGRDEVKKASESIIRESKLKAKRKLKHGRHDDDFQIIIFKRKSKDNFYYYLLILLQNFKC